MIISAIGDFSHRRNQKLDRLGYGTVIVFVMRGPMPLATLLPRNSLSQVRLEDVELGCYRSPEIEN